MSRFGYNSVSELQFVRAELCIMSTEALIYVSDHGFDFSIFDGLRTEAEQRKNIRRGVSWTMNSLHLPQADGLSHAVDLVPYIDGRLMWDNPKPATQKKVDRCFQLIHEGCKESANKHGFSISLGWEMWGKDKPHIQLGGN